MSFEEVYSPGLAFSSREKQAYLTGHGVVAVWMFIDGEIMGESYGRPQKIIVLDEGITRSDIDSMYCYSTTILPSYQGAGYGAILKSHWLALVASSGFGRVIGHARPGASQALNQKFGAVFTNDMYEDWYGSGETYRFYRLKLPKKREFNMSRSRHRRH